MGGNVPSAGLAVIAKNHDSDFSPRELVGCSSPSAWPQPPALDSRSFWALGHQNFLNFRLKKRKQSRQSKQNTFADSVFYVPKKFAWRTSLSLLSFRTHPFHPGSLSLDTSFHGKQIHRFRGGHRQSLGGQADSGEWKWERTCCALSINIIYQEISYITHG